MKVPLPWSGLRFVCLTIRRIAAAALLLSLFASCGRNPASPDPLEGIVLSCPGQSQALSAGVITLAGSNTLGISIDSGWVEVNGYRSQLMEYEGADFSHLLVLDACTNSVEVFCRGTGKDSAAMAISRVFTLVTARPCSALTQALLDSALHLGMTVYRGSNPPNIEADCFADSLQFDTANYSFSGSGQPVKGYSFSFHDQSFNGLVAAVEQQSDSGTDSVVNGTGFVSGDSAGFSLFFHVKRLLTATPDTAYYYSARILSGRWSALGILDCRIAAIMATDTDGRLIPRGSVRLYSETDGLVGRVSVYPYSPSAKSWKGRVRAARDMAEDDE